LSFLASLNVETVSINVNFNDLLTGANGKEVQSFDVTKIAFTAKGIDQAAGAFCVTGIYVMPSPQYIASEEGSAVEIFDPPTPNPIYAFEDFCSNGLVKSLAINNILNKRAQEKITSVQSPVWINYEIPTGSKRFYPFDHLNLSYIFWVEAVDENGDYFIIAPQVTVEFPHDGWIRSSQGNFLLIDQQFITTLLIDHDRNISTRLSTVVLMFTILSFIIGLIFVPNISSTLEVSIGILLGLWGLREVLIPPEIQGARLLSYFFLFAYYLFAIAAFIRFVTIPIYQKYKQSFPARKLPEDHHEEEP
jgi:hypothetical protein